MDSYHWTIWPLTPDNKNIIIPPILRDTSHIQLCILYLAHVEHWDSLTRDTDEGGNYAQEKLHPCLSICSIILTTKILKIFHWRSLQKIRLVTTGTSSHLDSSWTTDWVSDRTGCSHHWLASSSSSCSWLFNGIDCWTSTESPPTKYYTYLNLAIISLTVASS